MRAAPSDSTCKLISTAPSWNVHDFPLEHVIQDVSEGGGRPCTDDVPVSAWSHVACVSNPGQYKKVAEPRRRGRRAVWRRASCVHQEIVVAHVDGVMLSCLWSDTRGEGGVHGGRRVR